MLVKKAFYQRQDVSRIAKELLGKVLFTRLDGQITAGIIVETEAYSYRERGCHAFQNRMTARNQVMFETGGHAYVYLCYGIHHMFNVVTNVKGLADAVLVRALEPTQGVDIMQARMATNRTDRLTSGPGKLAKAMGIDRVMNGAELNSKQLWLEDRGVTINPKKILRSPRIGIDYAGEDAKRLWRFSVRDNKWVSK